MSQVTASITYFSEEGKVNLSECLRLAFQTVRTFGLSKLVIFTGEGEGLKQAADSFLSQPEYSHVSLVGVTFPQGFEVKREESQDAEIFSQETVRSFVDRGIPIVRARLPFDVISAQYKSHGILAQDMGIVGNALNIFCGSMSLCVQAVLMACDAGEVGIGEHIVVMTSDTALIVRAAPTARLLTDLIVRQIVCKPAFLTIAKGEDNQLPESSDDDETPAIELLDSNNGPFLEDGSNCED
jgi:hypothetical protein